MNQYDLFKQAIDEAESTMRVADNIADRVARMLIGRLRKCSVYVCRRLKSELNHFNAVTGSWK